MRIGLFMMAFLLIGNVAMAQYTRADLEKDVFIQDTTPEYVYFYVKFQSGKMYTYLFYLPDPVEGDYSGVRTDTLEYYISPTPDVYFDKSKNTRDAEGEYIVVANDRDTISDLYKIRKFDDVEFSPFIPKNIKRNSIIFGRPSEIRYTRETMQKFNERWDCAMKIMGEKKEKTQTE